MMIPTIDRDSLPPGWRRSRDCCSYQYRVYHEFWSPHWVLWGRLSAGWPCCSASPRPSCHPAYQPVSSGWPGDGLAFAPIGTLAQYERFANHPDLFDPRKSVGSYSQPAHPRYPRRYARLVEHIHSVTRIVSRFMSLRPGWFRKHTMS